MRTGIKELPKEERPRERLLSKGPSSLSNAELIAIVIGSGAGKGESAISLAEKVLSIDDGGLADLGVLAPEELLAVNGIGPAGAARIAAAAELGKRIYSAKGSKRQRVGNSDEAADILLPEMRYLKTEVFKVILLNVKNEIISVENCAQGSLNTAYITPRDVYSAAIKRGAAAIVAAHNHPSGNPEPSDSDFVVTQRLYEAGELLGITLLDHIVIGDGTYRSIMTDIRGGGVPLN